MRLKFDEQLENLNTQLMTMGASCENAIALAVEAVTTGDGALAEKAVEIDLGIDKAESDIENLCIRLLLQQQPVAKDLRVISAALKMITDMERIGDQASDIAEIALGSPELYKFCENTEHIKCMAREAIKMVTESIESFVKRDLELARSVMEYDDVVDDLFIDVRNDIVDEIMQDSKSASSYLDLLMIAKYFERIGDHATNIAEWVEFSINGKHQKVNDATVRHGKNKQNNA